jgi:hypothetical protein
VKLFVPLPYMQFADIGQFVTELPLKTSHQNRNMPKFCFHKIAAKTDTIILANQKSIPSTKFL